MKKISYLLVIIFLAANIFSCSGYKPIFSSSNFKFKIADYTISGDKNLGNKIYSKLKYLEQNNENSDDAKDIFILINTIKNKNETSKDSSGKALYYKINLSTTIIVKNYITEEEILNEKLTFGSSYKVQNQYSETLIIENKIVENLINKTYEELLIKLTQNI